MKKKKYIIGVEFSKGVVKRISVGGENNTYIIDQYLFGKKYATKN